MSGAFCAFFVFFACIFDARIGAGISGNRDQGSGVRKRADERGGGRVSESASQQVSGTGGGAVWVLRQVQWRKPVVHGGGLRFRVVVRP